MFTQTLLTDNTQTCNIINKLSTKFFVKEGRDQFPVILLEASVHCTGLEKVQNLIGGTRQLCNSHPEKQLGAAIVGVSHSKTPLHKEALQTSSLLASYEKSIEHKGKWTSSALRLIRQMRAVCPLQEVQRPWVKLHVALWESHWGGSMKEQLDWTHHSTTEILEVGLHSHILCGILHMIY